jgi:hypothetical protein
LLKEHSNELDSLYPKWLDRQIIIPLHSGELYSFTTRRAITINPYLLLLGQSSSKLISIHSFAERNVIDKKEPIELADRLQGRFLDNGALSNIACSIHASIEQEPDGEYTLLLNDTPYKMAKISNNHYVVRIVKEKTEKEKRKK